MKFKTRLVVAFFTIILIPLVLSSALVCMVGKYQLSSIEKNYGIKNTTVESLASSVTVLTRLTEQPGGIDTGKSGRNGRCSTIGKPEW